MEMPWCPTMQKRTEKKGGLEFWKPGEIEIGLGRVRRKGGGGVEAVVGKGNGGGVGNCYLFFGFLFPLFFSSFLSSSHYTPLFPQPQHDNGGFRKKPCPPLFPSYPP